MASPDRQTPTPAGASVDSPTAELAAFAVQFDAREIPAATREVVRACLLDFVGVAAYAARGIPGNAGVVRALDEWMPVPGEHAVVGAIGTRGPLQAALLNGLHAHTLDFDDTNQRGFLHPGAPVIPAALAAAERVDCDGNAFLAAVAIGYEVACRVGAGLGTGCYARSFHPTAIAGIFGAAAAAARLLGANAAELNDAFGFCGSQASGAMQFLDNGSLNKRLHPGLAAHDGLWSVGLAMAGVAGSRAALEGRNGLLTGYTDTPRPEALAQALGTDWLTTVTAIKPYPSCRLTHAGIDAVLALRDRLAAGSQPTLRVRLNPSSFNVVGERQPLKLRPKGIVDAQFSIYFQLAVTLLDGPPGWSSYERIGDPAVEAIAERIRVESSSDIPFNGCEVTVEGTGLSQRIDYPLGEPERPLAWQDIEHKFFALADVAYARPHAEAVSNGIRHIEEAPSMKAFGSLLRGDASPERLVDVTPRT